MIAKVKIAPVENWCKYNLERLPLRPGTAKIAGMEIEIDTDSMHISGGERHWDLTRESYRNLIETAEWPIVEFILYHTVDVCEHLLEMD